MNIFLVRELSFFAKRSLPFFSFQTARSSIASIELNDWENMYENL